MIEYKINLNRFYDTKNHKIVSKKKAHDYMLKYHKVPIAVKGNAEKKHTKRISAKSKRSHKSGRSTSYSRPSYKALYKNVSKRLQKSTVQLHKLENQYSADKFHPFIATRTKYGEVTPKTNIKDVQEWMKHHTGKLFVVAALGTDNHDIVKACGSVDDITAAGFAARDMVPELVQIFEDGYND